MNVVRATVVILAFTVNAGVAQDGYDPGGAPKADRGDRAEHVVDDAAAGDCCGNARGDCCAAACCGCCCPSWTVRAGYVHLRRERLGSDFAVLEGRMLFPTGPLMPIYTATRFDFDSSPGLDLSIIRDLGCGRGVELRYLGVEDFASDETPRFDTTLMPATNPMTNTGSNPGTSTNVHYESKLWSLELLGRRNCGWLHWLYGFRYFSLDERFNTSLISILPTRTAFQTQNDLFGFQLGTEACLWRNCGGLHVDGITKAGIYLNHAEAMVSATSVGSPRFNRFGRARDDRAAFVGELGVVAQYDVSCSLSVRCGYQLLLLDGVALGADQVPSTGEVSLGGIPITPIDLGVDRSSLLFHGFNVGLEYRR